MSADKIIARHLPKLLLDGWVPLVTLLGRLYAEKLAFGGGSTILRTAVQFLDHPPLHLIAPLEFALYEAKGERSPHVVGSENAFF